MRKDLYKIFILLDLPPIRPWTDQMYDMRFAEGFANYMRLKFGIILIVTVC